MNKWMQPFKSWYESKSKLGSTRYLSIFSTTFIILYTWTIPTVNFGSSRLNLPHHFGLASLSATPHIPEDLLIAWGGHLVISPAPDERRFRKQTDVNLASGSSCCSPAGQHGIDFEVSGLSSGTRVLNAHFSRLSEILIKATHAEHGIPRYK